MRRLSIPFLALLLLPRVAGAQVGSGWTEYTPTRKVQIRGCGMHADGEVETFGLTCDSTSGDNRAEARVENDYTSGTRQFQGEVRVVNLPGTNVSLKQTFMRDNGAFLMLGVTGEGRLYVVGDNAELATGVIGRWVRINTVHDVAAGTIEVHVDGVLRFVKKGARQVAWYDKFGSYRLGSGHGPITVEWKAFRFWKDGKGTGGEPTPPPDGGPADGAPGPAPTPDAGAPSPSPDGAAAGSGGEGGSAGTGGNPDDGAAPPTVPSAQPSSKGCGCTLGVVPRAHAGGGWLLAGLLFLLRRRRRGSGTRRAGTRRAGTRDD